MKRFLLLLFLFASLTLFAASAWYYAHFRELKTKPETVVNSRLRSRLTNRASLAKDFIIRNRYNSDWCFLVDMSIESGANRFFVYDLKNDSVLQSGLVTHGRCNEEWLVGRRYGNEVGCGCTSLGKYRIGNPYKGKFGLAYKLHGLDSTNSRAFERFVVLHSHECVPPREVKPAPICQSDGCPTVAPAFLQSLSDIINRSKKPVLLWIYE